MEIFPDSFPRVRLPRGVCSTRSTNGRLFFRNRNRLAVIHKVDQPGKLCFCFRYVYHHGRRSPNSFGYEDQPGQLGPTRSLPLRCFFREATPVCARHLRMCSPMRTPVSTWMCRSAVCRTPYAEGAVSDHIGHPPNPSIVTATAYRTRTMPLSKPIDATPRRSRRSRPKRRTAVMRRDIATSWSAPDPPAASGETA